MAGRGDTRTWHAVPTAAAPPVEQVADPAVRAILLARRRALLLEVAEIEQAVSRTSAQYMGDLRAMLAEVGKVYEGQIAAKDEALAAKDQSIAMQAETIAELRRRAEVGAAAVVRRREEQEAVQAAPEAPGTPEAPAEVREDRPRVWRRIRQWWHG